MISVVHASRYAYEPAHGSVLHVYVLTVYFTYAESRLCGFSFRGFFINTFHDRGARYPWPVLYPRGILNGAIGVLRLKRQDCARIQFEGRLEQSRINQRVANPYSDTPDTYNPTSDRGNMTVSGAVRDYRVLSGYLLGTARVLDKRVQIRPRSRVRARACDRFFSLSLISRVNSSVLVEDRFRINGRPIGTRTKLTAFHTQCRVIFVRELRLASRKITFLR